MSGEGFRAQDRTVSDWFSLVRSGALKLPRFQRHEAWDSGTVVGLVETVLRDLPAGAALTLTVGNEEPFESRHLVTAPEVDGAVHEHLLDGQQRLTALWRSLYGTYDDLSLFVRWVEDEDHPGSEGAVVESQPRWSRNGSRYPLWCDSPEKVFERGLVPVTLLAPDAHDKASEWLQQAIGDPPEVISWINRLSALRQRIAAYNVPYLSLPAATPRDVALDVFIKMNTSNIRLTPFDIVVAQVEAAAGASMHELLEGIRSEVPDAETYADLGTLLLDTSCLLSGWVASKANYLRLNFGTLPDLWRDLVDSLHFVVEMLEEERIYDEARLPTGTVLPVIAALARELPDSGDERGNVRALLRYYLWRAFLTRRYESSTGSRAFRDYQALRSAIRERQSFDDVSAPIFNEGEYPIPDAEQLVVARWPKTRDILGRGVLALMLREGARDLADDTPATRKSVMNREYHHLFPDSTLVKRAQLDEAESYRALNCALITWHTNRKVSNLSPLQYLNDRVSKANLGENEVCARLESHIVPWAELKSAGPYPDDCDPDVIRNDYFSFLETRAALMAPKAADRAGAGRVGRTAFGLTAEGDTSPGAERESTPQTIGDADSSPDVGHAFEQAMKDVYRRAKQEAGYEARYYLQMLAELGGLGTAHRLLASSSVSDGFTRLWERNRLDLTVENVVLRPEFAELFDPEELDVARRRLTDYGFDPKH